MLNSAVLCLALTIYYEARSEPLDGQVAVAQVVTQRVKSSSYPNSICAVVKQKYQFSFYWDGKPEKPEDMIAWGKAIAIAQKVKNGKLAYIVPNCLWYYNPYIADPKWAKNLKLFVQIGKHKFMQKI